MSQTHRHGLSFGWLSIMVIALGVFALVYALLDGPVSLLFEVGSEETSRDAITEGRGYAQTFTTWAPFIALVAACLAVIARAIFESAQPR